MKEELTTNAKRLSPNAQYEIRKSIIRLIKQGKRKKEVAEILDVSLRHVQNTQKAYEGEGIAGIKPKQRGRKQGEKRVLTPEQEREIQRAIVDKNPEQLRLPGCMWTRSNIRDYIGRKYKIDIKLSTLGYYLARWGFSVQRPVKRARKQDAKQIDAWLNEEFPGINERAQTEDAEIFFGDEAGIQNTANYAKGYAPKGQTPVVELESRKMKINMLSAVSKRGKLRFLLYKDNMNADKLIDFMRRLVADTHKKVFLILDNLRVHHSKKVRAWLEKHRGEIEVFFLPPYAPEYNPDELLNSDLKRGVGNRAMPNSESELEHNVRSHLKSLQLNPAKIQSFFAAGFTCYAA
jgi:Transposase and inactivated derivatives